MKITVRNLNRKTNHLIKNIKFAAAKTLNGVTYKAKSTYIPAYLKANLDIKKNPVSNAFLFTRATKNNVQTLIYMKDDWHRGVLTQHFEGGDRDRKGFEKAMVYEDHLSPTGISIQSQYTKTISKKRYRKITNEIRGGGKSKYFVIENAQRTKPAGVYERFKTKVKLLTVFVERPNYSDILDLEEPVSEAIKDHFDTDFHTNLQNALR